MTVSVESSCCNGSPPKPKPPPKEKKPKKEKEKKTKDKDAKEGKDGKKDGKKDKSKDKDAKEKSTKETKKQSQFQVRIHHCTFIRSTSMNLVLTLFIHIIIVASRVLFNHNILFNFKFV